MASCPVTYTRIHPVIRTEGSINLYKHDIPELGTRPLYFYRKPNRATASPREFWGFFTFNQDPRGPTGLTVRYSEPFNLGRVVSESLPPDPPDYMLTSVELGL
jgi:hypothetical protein